MDHNDYLKHYDKKLSLDYRICQFLFTSLRLGVFYLILLSFSFITHSFIHSFIHSFSLSLLRTQLVIPPPSLSMIRSMWICGLLSYIYHCICLFSGIFFRWHYVVSVFKDCNEYFSRWKLLIAINHYHLSFTRKKISGHAHFLFYIFLVSLRQITSPTHLYMYVYISLWGLYTYTQIN